METTCTPVYQFLYAFPHHQIVPAMLVEIFVGSSKLEDCTLAEMKKHGPCDGSFVKRSLNHETVSRL
jgi:hypothetical protein